MKNFLYLAPFADKKHFKFGITTNLGGRLARHHQNYTLGIDKWIVFSADSRVISFLENELRCSLSPCESVESFNLIDGYTEIRSIKDLPEALDIINSKPEKLGILREEFIIPKKEKKIIVQKKERVYINDGKVNDEVFNKDFPKFRNEFLHFSKYVFKIDKRIGHYDSKEYYDIYTRNFNSVFSNLKMTAYFSNGVTSVGVLSEAITQYDKQKFTFVFPKIFFGKEIKSDLYLSSINQIIEIIEHKKNQLSNEKLQFKRNRRRNWGFRKDSFKTNSDNFRQTQKPLF